MHNVKENVTYFYALCKLWFPFISLYVMFWCVEENKVLFFSSVLKIVRL